MSRILRQFGQSSTVIIGDRHSDVERELAAERVLSELFPDVEVITSFEGRRMVPLNEFTKIKAVLDKVMSGSWERGNKDGYQRGLNEGQRESVHTLQEFDEAVKCAIADRQRLYEEAKSNILALVSKISKKVTYDAISINPEITLKIISGVIDQLVDKTSIKIKVNPAHLPVVEQNVDKFLKTDSTIKQYQIEGDTRVKYGGCLIETPTGDIDARLESQFEVVNQALATGDV